MNRNSSEIEEQTRWGKSPQKKLHNFCLLRLVRGVKCGSWGKMLIAVIEDEENVSQMLSHFSIWHKMWCIFGAQTQSEASAYIFLLRGDNSVAHALSKWSILWYTNHLDFILQKAKGKKNFNSSLHLGFSREITTKIEGISRWFFFKTLSCGNFPGWILTLFSRKRKFTLFTPFTGVSNCRLKFE